MTALTDIKAWLADPGRWQRSTRRLRAKLEAHRTPVVNDPIDLNAFPDLPAPVREWLSQVLTDGQRRIEAVDIRHSGQFNTNNDGERWRPFRSEQRVLIDRPGFHWDARIAFLPGIAVRVHDAYIAGRGLLRAAVGGLITVVNLEDGGDLAAGELMRYAAEAAWYPTALLPGPNLDWAPIDQRSARLTLRDSGHAISLVFGFDDNGLLATVTANDRPRLVAGEAIPTAWQGRFWNYQRRGGLCIPTDGEVSWLLPDGPRPYWRGHLDAIRCELAR